jgi:hypothetical protein
LRSQLTYSSDTHTFPTRHATRSLFTVPKSRTNSRKSTYIQLWHTHLPHQTCHQGSFHSPQI